MRIRSSCTLEEYVEAQERILARSGVARSWKKKSALTGACVSGIIVYIFAIVVFGGSFIQGLAWTGIAAIIGAAISWAFYDNSVHRRLYNYYQEQFGARESFPLELELTDSGIWTKQMGIQIIFEWPNVEEIEETEESIDFYMRDGSGGIFVKKSDFPSVDEQLRFKEMAQGYLNISRTSSNWLHDS